MTAVVPPDPRAVRAAAYRDGALGRTERVLAMVSGGPDSMFLMHALAGHPAPVDVLTVDHGLRPEAARECRMVMDAARALGLTAHSVALGLPPGAGVAQRARAARYDAARDLAARLGCDLIATGHTMDDLAETVLMRLARGTGRTGALAMVPRRGDLARPLLGVRARDTRAWCAARGVVTADDPSNRDARATRVRARRLLGDLEGLHAGATGHLAAFASRMADEQGVLDAACDAAWGRCARGPGLGVSPLRAEHPSMRALLVRRMMAAAGLGGDALSHGAVRRVLDLLDGPARAQVAGGEVVRSGGVITAHAGPRPTAPGPTELPVPGRVAFGEVVVRASRAPAPLPGSHRVALRCDGPFAVRGPLPGDRLAIADGHARIGRLLASAGVPPRLRDLVPVVTAADRPVWVAGHRADASMLAAPGEPSVLLQMETT